MREKQGFFTIKDGRVKLIDRGGYKTTADAVRLAGAAAAAPGRSVLDVGIGPGGAGLCLLDDRPDLQITGIDISEAMIADARENARLCGRRIELVHGDIMAWRGGRLFDVVITNPPYFSGTPRADGAHHNADIHAWVRACVRHLRARGHFFCIVDIGVFDRVVAALYDSKCGAITLRAGGPRVIISGRLGVGTPAAIGIGPRPV